MSISIIENYTPNKNEIEQISIPLRRYNSKLIGSYKSQDILVSLAEGDAFVGGGYAIIKLGWLHIDLLWVEPQFRKMGYGALLLNKLETIALNKFHIKNAKLNTGDFQGALGFYKHHGYTTFAQLEVFPENGDKDKQYIDFYMKKSLIKSTLINAKRNVIKVP